jgi:inner membrane protein YidH
MNRRASQAGSDEQQKDQGEQRDSSEGVPPPAQASAATARDYLASERTLLAWVRTGLALIGLGFVVARFGLFLREVGAEKNSLGSAVLGEHWSTLLGTVMILLAALLVILSYLRYHGVTHALEQGTYYHSRGLSLGMAALVVLIALGLAAYLLLSS